jgi:signal recognition particle receptor subunit beta
VELNEKEAPPTIPTVGTNLVTLKFGKKTCTVRELGGCMSPVWNSYHKDVKNLIYVIDMANRQQVAASCIELLTTLSSKYLQESHVLLLFNKIDIPMAMTIPEISSILRLDDIVATSSQNIDFRQCSAWKGDGLNEVLSWLNVHAAHN